MVDGAPGTVALLGTALAHLGMSPRDLWIRYFAVGGNGSLSDVAAWLDGRAEPSDKDHDLMAHALNEEFAARDQNHPVGYRLHP